MQKYRSRSGRRGRLAIAIVASLALLVTALPGSAAAHDVNNDKLPDSWEKRYDLSLKVKQTRRDQDGDDIRNLGEFKAGTNPRDVDSDGDGVPDSDENAGTIASFTPGTDAGTGTLVIDLYAGGSVSGEVDEDTDIVCLLGDDPAVVTSSHPRGPSGPDGAPPQTGPTSPGSPGTPDPDGPGVGDDPPAGCQHGTPCSTDDLVQGAVIHQALVNVDSNGTVFKRVEIAPSD